MENLQNLPLDAAISKLIDLIVSFGSRLLIAIIVFFVGRWIIRRIINVVVKAMQRRKVEASLFSFVRSMVKITLYFLFRIILIGILGIETSSFIALFASAGIAIGAAMSGTLQNFAGGVMILLFKPFKVGDYIEAQGQSGTVKEIQIQQNHHRSQRRTFHRHYRKLFQGRNPPGGLGIRHRLRRQLRQSQRSHHATVKERHAHPHQPGLFHCPQLFGRKLGEHCSTGMGQKSRLLECLLRHERKSVQNLCHGKPQHSFPANGCPHQTRLK